MNSILIYHPSVKGKGRGNALCWIRQCGRGAPFEVKLGGTWNCSRVRETKFAAYIYFRHQASNVASFQ